MILTLTERLRTECLKVLVTISRDMECLRSASLTYGENIQVSKHSVGLNKMKKVITYGTYDLLHQGHINLLMRAKALGDYLIVGVTNDNFDRDRGKLNVRNNVLERVEAVKATGLADQIIIEDYIGQKIDDIQKYNVDIFAIGSDWKGKFDYLNEFCKVVYLPRTEGISSTLLREESQETVRVGIIGCGRMSKRFPSEAEVVSGVKVCAAYDIESQAAEDMAEKHDV